MAHLIFSINVVLPLFLMMMLGYFFTRYKVWSPQFTKEANKISFKIFLPLLLFNNVYQSDLKELLDFRLVACAMLGVISVVVVASVIVLLTVKKENQKGVLIQAIFRSNFLLFGIPMVTNIFGQEGAGVAATLIAFVVPLYNFSAVIVLTLFSGGEKKPLYRIILDILKNPLIIGSLTGLLFSCLHIVLPTSVNKVIKDLASVGTPLALLILGAEFEFEGLTKNIKPLLMGVLGKLLIVPGIMMALFVLLGFKEYALISLLAAFGAPTAVNSYIMAQQAGGDGELAGQLVVVSTVLAPFTLCLFIYVFKTLALI